MGLFKQEMLMSFDTFYSICCLLHFLVTNTMPFCLLPSRHLAGEVAKEWQEVEENDKTQQETLLKLVKEIVPYNMAHNAEHEACDLLMEIERLDMLEDYIDENAYGKVCLYLTRYVHVLLSENTNPIFF